MLRRGIAALALAAGALGAQGTPAAGAGQYTPSAAPQVFLMTIGPGGSIDARFGHTAIWVRDTLRGYDSVYNYGTFDYGDPRFVTNFIRGRPPYWLSVGPLEWVLAGYRAQERSVTIQELNLRAPLRAELVFMLEQNALPENRIYQYDYYLDNCTTRVRDLLDRILQGALSTATRQHAARGNLRFHTQRSLTNNPFLYFGIMALMGPSTDAPLDEWGEMFLPAKLQERVRDISVTGPDGTRVPLVTNEQVLIPMDVHRVRDTPPSWGFGALLAGALLGAVVLLGSRRGGIGMGGRIVARGWLVACGLGGILILYVWFATNHVAAADNRNVLLLSPLAWFLLPQVGRPGAQGKASRFLWLAFAGSLGVGTLLALVPALGVQWNLQLAALVVPPSVAVLWLTRPRASALRSLP